MTSSIKIVSVESDEADHRANGDRPLTHLLDLTERGMP